MRTFLLALSATALLCAAGCGTTDDDDATDGGCNLLIGDEQPEVFIDEPDNGLMVDTTDPINWIVLVTDPDSELDEIGLEAFDLSSGTSQDLDYDVPTPDAEGRSEFTLSGDTLGSGVVVVRIQATDSLGCVGHDQVVVCIDVPSSDCTFD